MSKKEYLKKWREKNKAKTLEYTKNWKKSHKKQVSESAKRYYVKNIEKIKEYRLKNKDRIRESYRLSGKKWKIKHNYGITLDEYQVLFEKQNGVCAICLKPESRKNNKGIDSLAIDHNHETGKVRELLCHRCNAALGMFFEDPLLLEKARDYLIKWSK